MLFKAQGDAFNTHMLYIVQRMQRETGAHVSIKWNIFAADVELYGSDDEECFFALPQTGFICPTCITHAPLWEMQTLHSLKQTSKKNNTHVMNC